MSNACTPTKLHQHGHAQTDYKHVARRRKIMQMTRRTHSFRTKRDRAYCVLCTLLLQQRRSTIVVPVIVIACHSAFQCHVANILLVRGYSLNVHNSICCPSRQRSRTFMVAIAQQRFEETSDWRYQTECIIVKNHVPRTNGRPTSRPLAIAGPCFNGLCEILYLKIISIFTEF